MPPCRAGEGQIPGAAGGGDRPWHGQDESCLQGRAGSTPQSSSWIFSWSSSDFSFSSSEVIFPSWLRSWFLNMSAMTFSGSELGMRRPFPSATWVLMKVENCSGERGEMLLCSAPAPGTAGSRTARAEGSGQAAGTGQGRERGLRSVSLPGASAARVPQRCSAPGCFAFTAPQAPECPGTAVPCGCCWGGGVFPPAPPKPMGPRGHLVGGDLPVLVQVHLLVEVGRRLPVPDEEVALGNPLLHGDQLHLEAEHGAARHPPGWRSKRGLLRRGGARQSAGPRCLPAGRGGEGAQQRFSKAEPPGLLPYLRSRRGPGGGG